MKIPIFCLFFSYFLAFGFFFYSVAGQRGRKATPPETQPPFPAILTKPVIPMSLKFKTLSMQNMQISPGHTAKHWQPSKNDYFACSQETFCEYFFVFAREFCIEKRRGFLVNFFRSPFPTKGSTKTPRKTRGKFGAEFTAKFGTKIRKIRETFGLQLF